jgi:hypothetical protein
MKALAIRPYGDRIRNLVFGLLKSADLEVSTAPELSEQVPDAKIVDYLRKARTDVLLLPFHAVRTAEGERSDGMQLLERIRNEIPHLAKIPVIMPVSVFASAAFSGGMRRNPHSRLFAISEDEMEKDSTALRLREFLRDPDGVNWRRLPEPAGN